jgi:hypothetical protein
MTAKIQLALKTENSFQKRVQKIENLEFEDTKVMAQQFYERLFPYFLVSAKFLFACSYT